MRWVEASACAAVVTGSRRKRWQAIQSVEAPPSSAAFAWAAIDASGARPSIAMPNSATGESIAVLELGHQLGQAAAHQRRLGQCLLDRTGILEAGRRQQRHAALVRLDRALRAQPLD